MHPSAVEKPGYSFSPDIAVGVGAALVFFYGFFGFTYISGSGTTSAEALARLTRLGWVGLALLCFWSALMTGYCFSRTARYLLPIFSTAVFGLVAHGFIWLVLTMSSFRLV
jgi:hypothetical protein